MTGPPRRRRCPSTPRLSTYSLIAAESNFGCATPAASPTTPLTGDNRAATVSLGGLHPGSHGFQEGGPQVWVVLHRLLEQPLILGAVDLDLHASSLQGPGCDGVRVEGQGHRFVSLEGKVELEGEDTCLEVVPRPQRDANLPWPSVFVAQAHGHNPSQAEAAVTVGGQSGRFCGQGGYPKWLPGPKKSPVSH